MMVRGVKMKKYEGELLQIIKEYNKKKKPINFNFKNAYSRLLRENNLLNQYNNNNNINFHYIHYYPGRIYPYIPRYLLSLPEFQHLDGYLLDPFSGSGTILLEAIINPIVKRFSFGVEINPLGRLISKVKTTYIDVSQIDEIMKELYKLYSQQIPIDKLSPEYKNINLWFSDQAIKKLCKLKYAIENIDISVDQKDFLWLCFSNIIRKVSMADPYIPPPVLLKLEKYRNTPKYTHLKEHLYTAKYPDLWKIFMEIVKKNVNKLREVFKLFVQNNKVNSEIIWDNAVKIKKGKITERGGINKKAAKTLSSNSIDIILTSPPYLTAQKYIRTSKLELLWLGYSIKDINEIDKSSIGTEKVSLTTEITEFGIPFIDSLIADAVSKSKERGLTIYHYFKNMLNVIKEMHRLLKKEGYFILVVGDNKVLGKKIDTYKLLSDIAILNGFKEIVILKDEIRNRSMITKRNGSGGLIKNEYVVILRKEG